MSDVMWMAVQTQVGAQSSLGRLMDRLPDSSGREGGRTTLT